MKHILHFDKIYPLAILKTHADFKADLKCSTKILQFNVKILKFLNEIKLKAQIIVSYFEAKVFYSCLTLFLGLTN